MTFYFFIVVMEVIIFDTTKELFRFLKEIDSINDLALFKDTPEKSIPADNVGYVILGENNEVLGAASLYEEETGTWFNELFEIAQEHRGKGIGRYLYEFIKEDLEPEKIHGFCTTPENKSFWEHLGQVCIDKETNEMLEIVNKKEDEV